MPRAPRPGRERRAPVEPETLHWLLYGERPADNFELFLMDGLGDGPKSPLRALWGSVGGALTAAYANDRPGHRPWAWWRLEAPEMRRRLGGHGVTESSLLAVVPTFDRGIPSDWLLDDFSWTYDGGKPPAGYVALDRSNPPTFESQATYLRRLKLFLPGEARRLKAADFEAEGVEIFDTPNDPGPIHDETCSTRGISPETD
jgi:hypothetical protein